MKTIIIANQKGGVAKTATAAALWTGLNQRGKKTIAIDLDPQCNLTDSAAAAADYQQFIDEFIEGVKK